MALISKNVTTHRRTSVRMDPYFWDSIEEICRREGLTRNAFVGKINQIKPKGTNLSCAVRVFVLAYFRRAAALSEQPFADAESELSRAA